MPTFSRPAPCGELRRAVGHVLEHLRAERRRAVALGMVLLAAGHERGLAHAQGLQRRADLAVEAHRAEPALRLVLSGMGEWDGSSHKGDHKGCVL